MPTITLPHNFTPRHYQLPVLQAMDNGATRVVACWHRRSGKEKTFLNYMVRKCFDRVGTYFYAFPTYTQGKRALWDGRDRDGFPFMGHFPKEVVAASDATELKKTLINGSIFQIVGTDNIDSLMSTNPVGVVFAEYSLQDPRGWDYLRPILRENGGWAAFDYTPRGKNHGYTLYDMGRKLMAEGDPAWYVERLTVDDTGVLTSADIDAERREGMDEEMIQQEYFCSFEGAQMGAYYGRAMDKAETEGRVCGVPCEPGVLVDTAWDLGIGDATSIWFTQNVGREVHVIDYYENSGEGLPHYAKVLQDRGYLYGRHVAPHDIRVRELGSGKSRLETAEGLGIRFEVAPDLGLLDGIDATRAFIPVCWFDRAKTERGRLALSSYHKTWDERRKAFLAQPYHDWSEHGASAFRYLAIGHKVTQARRDRPSEPRRMMVASGDPSQSWLGA
jgi:phage terminase large subunit